MEEEEKEDIVKPVENCKPNDKSSTHVQHEFCDFHLLSYMHEFGMERKAGAQTKKYRSIEILSVVSLISSAQQQQQQHRTYQQNLILILILHFMGDDYFILCWFFSLYHIR